MDMGISSSVGNEDRTIVSRRGATTRPRLDWVGRYYGLQWTGQRVHYAVGRWPN